MIKITNYQYFVYDIIYFIYRIFLVTKKEHEKYIHVTARATKAFKASAHDAGHDQSDAFAVASVLNPVS